LVDEVRLRDAASAVHCALSGGYTASVRQAADTARDRRSDDVAFLAGLALVLLGIALSRPWASAAGGLGGIVIGVQFIRTRNVHLAHLDERLRDRVHHRMWHRWLVGWRWLVGGALVGLSAWYLAQGFVP
jgi:hypothetical protein